MNLDTTIKALQEGATHLALDKGIQNIASWMDALEKADFRGAKVIHENLGKLKGHLEAAHLDGPAIGKLLRTLGEETTRAASQVEGAQGEKVTRLGELLGKSGSSLSK